MIFLKLVLREMLGEGMKRLLTGRPGDRGGEEAPTVNVNLDTGSFTGTGTGLACLILAA